MASPALKKQPAIYDTLAALTKIVNESKKLQVRRQNAT